MGGSSVEFQKHLAVSEHLLHCWCFRKPYQAPTCLRGLVPHHCWRSGRGRDPIKISSDISDQSGRLCTRQRWRTANFWSAHLDKYRALCFVKLFLLIASSIFFLCWFFSWLITGFLDLSELFPIFKINYSLLSVQHGAHSAVALLFIPIFHGSTFLTIMSLPTITSLTLSHWYFLSLPGPFSYCCHAQVCNEYFLIPMWQIIMFFLIANHVY